MELRHLRYFVAVAESLNFSKAAARLHIAQPPLSRQIKQLEDELGTALLVRDRRSVVLTDAGRVFLQEARGILNQTVHAVDSVRRAAKGELGKLRVGIGSGLGQAVNRGLFEHVKSHPGVEVECQDILSSLQNAALVEREIDVGFMRPPVDAESLTSQKLFEEPFYVYIRKSHPLARRRKLKLADLKDETLLLYDRNVSRGVYDKTLELYREAGLTPRIIRTRTAPYDEAGAVLVASGKGIYLGVGAVREKPGASSEVALVPLDEPNAKVYAHVVWRKGETSGVVLAFLETVKRVFRNNR
ncbi:MAG TPA: LysR substrate-binding domain-containing protein [Methylomirabilota bacterium]|nr:LysR substrate-binding domain-containing protein [Methylomirabilota bacterium]